MTGLVLKLVGISITVFLVLCQAIIFFKSSKIMELLLVTL
jgi:hypothetical protein